MTERTGVPAPDAQATAVGKSAGTLLREARERQGLHIAVLAAAIKVSTRKLDALENDRYSELPDITFTRALTQTVCRALKLDPQPVLAQLPAAHSDALDSAYDGLNMPFKAKDSRKMDGLPGWLPKAPLLWAAGALLLAAALVMYWPTQPGVPAAPASTNFPAVVPGLPDTARPNTVEAAPVSTPASAAALVAGLAASAAASVQQPVAAAPAAVPDSAARPPALPSTVMPSSQGASISVSEPVWVEVVDSTGQVIFQRTIQPGEVMNFEQRPPLKLRIGNAASAKLAFKGEAVDLAPLTKGNVARVELK